MAHATGLPLRLVQQALGDLVAGRLLEETLGRKPNEPAFQPAMDIQLLTLQRVSDALESGGVAEAWILPSDENTAKLREALRRLSQAAAEAPANQLLKDL
jgi:DNA-binding GntR family transcriptional regulator